jgi:hypothetical protein
VVAEIFLPLAAEETVAVNAAHPGDADAGLWFELLEAFAEALDAADDLMAGDDGGVLRFEIAGGDVEIGAADAAGFDFEKYLIRSGFRDGDVFYGKRMICNEAGMMKDGGSHRN